MLYATESTPSARESYDDNCFSCAVTSRSVIPCVVRITLNIPASKLKNDFIFCVIAAVESRNA